MIKAIRFYALLLLLVPPVLIAQANGSAAQQQDKTAQTKESLLIRPGDLLQVQVLDTPELGEQARVTDAGKLPMILGGAVDVANMTPGQAAHAIEATLVRQGYILKPHVLVTVAQYATQNVSVLGEVHNPGAYPIGTPRSILDVLALAGGVTDMAGRKIVIERHGTSTVVPYFLSNTPGDAMSEAVKVDPGDTVMVPRADLVYVLGDVGKPGGYTMTNNDGKISVLELVARAGGTLPSSVPSHARLIRKSGDGYVQSRLPLNKMQKGDVADVEMQPDDIIYVPFSYMRNFAENLGSVVGAVGGAAVYRF